MKSNKSLDRRRDVRTIKQFKEDISWSTQRENHLIRLYAKEMKFRGHKVKWENNGIDNSGKLVEYSDNRPDFKVTIDDKEKLVEVKANPYHHKQTFKVYDLDAYVKAEADILLFYHIGHHKTVVGPDTKWAIIETKNIEKMLKNSEIRTGDSKWGYKPVIIVYPRDYDKYWKEEIITCQD